MPKFNCPHCSQSIDAPDDLAGAEADCPACEKPITVPDIASTKPKETKPPKTKPKKKLPAWLEKKITSCKQQQKHIMESAHIEPDSSLQKTPDPTDGLPIMILVLAPWVGPVIFYNYIGNLAPIHAPIAQLNMALIVMGLVSGIVAGLDSMKWKGNWDNSPTRFCMMVGLFWVVGYPVYMIYRRITLKQTPLLIPLIGWLLYVITFYLLIETITD